MSIEAMNSPPNKNQWRRWAKVVQSVTTDATGLAIFSVTGITFNPKWVTVLLRGATNSALIDQGSVYGFSCAGQTWTKVFGSFSGSATGLPANTTFTTEFYLFGGGPGE